ADRIEILGVGLPAPGDALGQRGAGDVLDAFHQLDQPVLGAGPDGREADAAVAGDHRGDPVAAGWLEQTVPADLTVVVGVDVDEARRHDVSCGVYGFGSLSAQLWVVGAAADDVDDPAVLDADVGAEALGAGTVDNGAARDFQVVHDYP